MVEPPNPRLQRTPSASPPSPLSRQPLGHLKYVLLALIAIGLASESEARVRSPKLWQPPVGFKVIKDAEMKIEFAYPRTWQLVIDCEESVAAPCDITVVPPDDRPEQSDPEDEPLVPFRSVNIRVYAYSHWKALCGVPSHGVQAEGEPVVGGRSSGMTWATSVKTYSKAEYLGLGNGAEACLHDSASHRMVIITMRPPAEPTDPVFLEMVRSFRFLDATRR